MKVRNLKPSDIFRLFSALACERIFMKTHSIDCRCVIGSGNIMFSGAFVKFSARKLYRLG